jgi:hypothetical protein
MGDHGLQVLCRLDGSPVRTAVGSGVGVAVGSSVGDAVGSWRSEINLSGHLHTQRDL